jgi:hypothetical protein
VVAGHVGKGAAAERLRPVQLVPVQQDLDEAVVAGRGGDQPRPALQAGRLSEGVRRPSLNRTSRPCGPAAHRATTSDSVVEGQVATYDRPYIPYRKSLWVRSDASAPAGVEYDEVPVPAFAHKAAEVEADDLSNARMPAAGARSS